MIYNFDSKTFEYYYNNLDELYKIKNEISDELWEDISYDINLNEKFIIMFKDKVHWDIICSSIELSEELIEKCIDYINWDEISIHQKLSDKFIRKYNNNLDWKILS